jgi:hypothetical protein
VLVPVGAADVAAIQARLLRLDVFGPGVRQALAGMELAGLDLDRDGRADVAATYGCNGWSEGACQSHGQFFLVRRGERWLEIE